MARYDKDDFVSEEPRRKGFRDAARKKFFGQLGGEKLKDPFSFDPDPAAQLEIVKGLLKLANNIHTDDRTAIDMSTGKIGGLSLSISPSGLSASAIGRPVFERIRLTQYGDFFNLKNFY